MSDFIKVTLTIPVQHLAAANRLAAIFDFDTGGGDTFGACPLSPSGESPATHYMANTAIKTGYIEVLSEPDRALPALQQLAEHYGRLAPDPADVQAFCYNVIIGDPTGFVRVEVDIDEPAA